MFLPFLIFWDRLQAPKRKDVQEPFQNQKGKLVLLGGTDIVPMLERGNTYKVCLDLDQRLVDVQGGDIHFHGVSAYEYWNTVVDTANRVIASSKGGGKTIEAADCAYDTIFVRVCVGAWCGRVLRKDAGTRGCFCTSVATDRYTV